MKRPLSSKKRAERGAAPRPARTPRGGQPLHASDEGGLT
jgi:hypothetical protein